MISNKQKIIEYWLTMAMLFPLSKIWSSLVIRLPSAVISLLYEYSKQKSIYYMPNASACMCIQKYTNQTIKKANTNHAEPDTKAMATIKCPPKVQLQIIKLIIRKAAKFLQQIYTRYFRLLKPRRKSSLGQLNKVYVCSTRAEI